jgi:hypothetical protein
VYPFRTLTKLLMPSAMSMSLCDCFVAKAITWQSPVGVIAPRRLQ